MQRRQYDRLYFQRQTPQHQPQYPPVDITIFSHSVAAFQKIAGEAAVLLKKFAEPPFAHRLMMAAQAGQRMEVDRLVRSIGISTPVTTQYTPSGILLTMHADALGTRCCTLTIYLRWGN